MAGGVMFSGCALASQCRVPLAMAITNNTKQKQNPIRLSKWKKDLALQNETALW